LEYVVLALQWVMFHVGVVVTGPVILAQALHLSAVQTGELVRLTFVITGIGSIVQVLFGHRNMLVEGPAVPWWAAYLVLAGVAVAAGTPMAVVRTNIVGGLIVAGCVLVAAGLLRVIRRLSFLFSPRITGILLILIAVQISGVGVRGLAGHGSLMFLVGVGVILLGVMLVIHTRGLLKNAALLLSVIAGWIVTALVGKAPAVDLSGLSAVAVPRFFAWGSPTFDFGFIFALTVLGLLLIPNQIGSIKAMEHTTGNIVPADRYDRGLAATGFATLLAGLTGGIGTAPFAISAGLVSVTREKSNRGFLLGAFIFVLAGVIPVLGQFFGAIPVPVASAVMLISVSSLMVIGIQSVTREHLDMRGSFVVGLGLLIGTGIMFLPQEVWASTPYWLRSVLSNGVITGTVAAIALEQGMLGSGKREHTI